MAPEKFNRKLIAILGAEVKGYNRLMGEDEEATIRRLNVYLEAITGFIQNHQGRLVRVAGNSVLAEFANAVSAVQCAIEIQKELKTRNEDIPENRRMEFGIGINFGEVIEEGKDISGEGIDIGVQVSHLAEAGTICISGAVYDQVQNKLPLVYEHLGEQEVKGIPASVPVYRIQMEPQASASRVSKWKETGLKYWRQTPTVLKALATLVIALNAAWQLYSRVLSPGEVAPAKKVISLSENSTAAKMAAEKKTKVAFPTPDKPSIAVLPFENMSDDPKQEFLADGFAEEIINGLSKCPHIEVIARNSSFSYKGKPVKVQQIAEELGVQNVLEGSLRKTGDKVRITVQLIDALTGRHLFSERYDRELKDILVMQDQITMKILDAVQVKLTAGEDARLRAKGTKNLDAYLKLMQARQYMQFYNKESQARARQLTEEAISLDPQYGAAYATLCKVQLMQVVLGVHKNAREALKQAVMLGEKAIALDDSNSLARATLAATYAWFKEHDKAIAEAEKAVSLDPNSAYAYHALGSVLDWGGRSQEAIPFFKKSLRLSPIPIDTTTLIRMGSTYRNLGQYEESLDCFKKSLQLYGADHLGAHAGLVSTYAMMGREKEAQAEAAEVLRIDPKFSWESFARRLPLKDQKLIDDLLSAYRKVGLK